MGSTLAELARLVQGEVRGDSTFVVERVNSLDHAGPREITFAAGTRNVRGLVNTHAGAVILSPDDAPAFSGNAIVVKNPPLAFAHISAHLHPAPATTPGVHPTAVVDASARVAPTAAIAPSAVIGPDAVIGAGVSVGPGCVIGRGVMIGEHSRLVARVVVLDECRVGRNCLLHPGAVIGADGFGFAQDGSRWIKQPQLGRVVIGDDVEIGANTTIDRGTFADTTIGNGVKLDNLVHIAHNVRIGDDTAIAAFVGIAGSTVVGKRCTIAGQAGIIGHVEIADDVHITAATAVMSSLTKSGVYSSGIGAEPAAEWRRNVVRLHQLDELARRLRRLEQTIQQLDSDNSPANDSSGSKS
jgi:UDP-3-O-[3-hydroxymyristoyl] glucosamine N-acyltransferase